MRSWCATRYNLFIFLRRFNISDTSHPPENGDFFYKSIHKLRGRFYRHKILVILIHGAHWITGQRRVTKSTSIPFKWTRNLLLKQRNKIVNNRFHEVEFRVISCPTLYLICYSLWYPDCTNFALLAIHIFMVFCLKFDVFLCSFKMKTPYQVGWLMPHQKYDIRRWKYECIFHFWFHLAYQLCKIHIYKMIQVIFYNFKSIWIHCDYI